MAYLFENYEKTFDSVKGGIKMRGSARSALWSGFYLEQLRLAFDAGIPMHYPVKHILLTHTHSDHAYNLPIVLTETMTFQSTGENQIDSRPYVYTPKGTKQALINLMVAKHQMSRNDLNAPFDPNRVCILVEVSDGDEIPITVFGNIPMILKVFATEHKVTSVGYALFFVRTQLKPEFESLTGKQIAEKKKAGIVVNHTVQIPHVVYVGDSTPVWMRNTLFKQYTFPLIICECTFVGALEDTLQDAIDRANEHGHTCWELLEPLIKEKLQEQEEKRKQLLTVPLQTSSSSSSSTSISTTTTLPKTDIVEKKNPASNLSTTFCLVHWSRRYTVAQIENFFKDKPNIFAWTN